MTSTPNPQRAWVFTLNNPPEDEEFDWDDHAVTYAVYQVERGEQGTVHWQGYVVFERPRRLSAVKKIIERAHWEPRRGSHEQAKAYCTKEDSRIDGPFEYGDDRKVGQGKRSDLIVVCDKIIKEKMPLKRVAMDYPTVYVKYPKGLESLRTHCLPAREQKTKTYLVIGDAGLGKSYWCRDKGKNYGFDMFEKHMSTGNWWDGYDGQEAVMIDDFKGWIPFTDLLGLADEGPFEVQVKGRVIPFAAKVLFIVSNYEPARWYKSAAELHWPALVRRVERVIHFTAYKTYTKYESDAAGFAMEKYLRRNSCNNGSRALFYN